MSTEAVLLAVQLVEGEVAPEGTPEQQEAAVLAAWQLLVEQGQCSLPGDQHDPDPEARERWARTHPCR